MREEAIFAGGCFWCTEWVFKEQPGVLSVESGYTGGNIENPSYEEVCEGQTGHFEGVRILFDPEVITYWQLLESFWFHIDPFDFEGQFFDKGLQYRTAIFFRNATQKRLAEESKSSVERIFNQVVATQILPCQPFYPAESYHQGYCVKNPSHFQRYALSHEKRLKELWEGRYALPIKDLREKLTPLQYQVTQGSGTEAPFHNAYWDNKKEGIYVDIITGEPLFSSKDKFDSGTGWPSFSKALDPSRLIEREDHQLFATRTEVLSQSSGAHLGHLFPDGPPPTHMRYCMNSAALRFIPKS